MKRRVLFFSLFVFLFPFLAFAHIPEVVENQETITVSEPEVSKAFYGELEGKPHRYVIESSEPFLLYASILVPVDLPENTNLKAEVYKENGEGSRELVFTLEGSSYAWKKYDEEFGGDTYLSGPENEINAAAGKYVITVSRPENQGKYVLATGKQERFRAKDIVKTFLELPKLKKDFFGKSYFSVFSGIVGIAMLIIGLVVVAGIMLIIILVKRLRKRKKLSITKN